MSPSLEQERRALLEQFESSRAVYRRMLNGNHTTQTASTLRRASAISRLGPDFPRSHTMRWVIEHRWQLALGAAALILIRPGLQLAKRHNINKVRALPQNSKVKILTTTGMRLLQSRNSLHVAGRLASILLRLMQERRTNQN